MRTSEHQLMSQGPVWECSELRGHPKVTGSGAVGPLGIKEAVGCCLLELDPGLTGDIGLISSGRDPLAAAQGLQSVPDVVALRRSSHDQEVMLGQDWQTGVGPETPGP